jgi:ABC-type antimicrobial peptide transport system permease subunit
MIEQRAREIGILNAAGFELKTLRHIFLIEGIFLSATGSMIGLLGAIGYGWLMLFGLRTWWIDAVGTRQLSLHLSCLICTGVMPAFSFLLLPDPESAASEFPASSSRASWNHGVRPVRRTNLWLYDLCLTGLLLVLSFTGNAQLAGFRIRISSPCFNPLRNLRLPSEKPQ